MRNKSAYLYVAAAAKKVSQIDITTFGSGRSTKHGSMVRGAVFSILAKYYDMTRDDTAKVAGSDHGSVSYHVLLHDRRYKISRFYRITYDNLIDELYDTTSGERYRKIESLINEL